MTTTTGPDGTFELKYVRPGELFVQVAPFSRDPSQAPSGTSRLLGVEAGETVTGVELKAIARR